VRYCKFETTAAAAAATTTTTKKQRQQLSLECITTVEVLQFNKGRVASVALPHWYLQQGRLIQNQKFTPGGQ